MHFEFAVAFACGIDLIGSIFFKYVFLANNILCCHWQIFTKLKICIFIKLRKDWQIALTSEPFVRVHVCPCEVFSK